MSSIRKRQIGDTRLEVAELGFGGASIGNLYTAITNKEAQEVVDAAYDNGIRYFDTAPLYGYGLSERRIGLTLGGRSRDSFVLSTKVGRRLRPMQPSQVDGVIFENVPPFQPYYDYSYDGVMRSVEDSLQRLGLHRIDILFIHDVDSVNQGSVEETESRFREVMDGGYRALEQLRSEGSVSAIGVGLNEWEWCQRFAEAGDFDCFLLAGRYTLLEQESLNSFLPLCQRKKISVIIGGPYNTGVLATGAVSGAYYNYAPAPPEILDKVRRMEVICSQHRVSIATAALRFPLGHPAVVSVIPGARSMQEIQDNLDTFTANIPDALWAELKQEGLLQMDAPTPAQVCENE
jgi:D-threo-aldose 1-dehydrogenase